MQFERPHHQRIAHVLQALNGDTLRQHGCLFGGGTCIALRHGEYRESVDIDFLVSDAAGYRELRQLFTGPDGLAAITHAHAQPLEALREIRADQYGIRTQVQMDGQPIKLEIVREARIALEPPVADDTLCGVSTLTRLDLATSKLLANSDRQADDGVFSRDVIDLAMMGLPLPAYAPRWPRRRGLWPLGGARPGQGNRPAADPHRLAGALHAGHGDADAQGGVVAKGARPAARSARGWKRLTSPMRRRKPHHHVYVVELSKDVLSEPRFRKNNPGYVEGKPCVYVGMTGPGPGCAV
jgi:Domain of unknown function (DUF1814).